MAKVWFAGPKKGRANYFNVVRVSWEGFLVDFPCLMIPIFLAQLAENRFYPDTSFIVGLPLIILTFGAGYVLLRTASVFALRRHVDFENPYTKYRHGQPLNQGRQV